jgi:hypothetical protein
MAVAAVALVGTTAAHAGRWIPGTPYMVSEDDAKSFLERAVDHAYCQGVPRFGKQGEFPDEEFVAFDCSLDLGKYYCSDVRYRAVKGAHRGYFRMRGNLTAKDCY